MDGDATFKPVLHLVVAPIASEWLAPSVRTQLGMKNIPQNDGLILDGPVAKNTQKRQDAPTVGHVHSTNVAAKVNFNFGLFLFGLSIIVVSSISERNNLLAK